jgi:hypothetical protein
VSETSYQELELFSRRALHERSLTEHDLVAAHVVIDFSYARGVPVARFKRLDFFCAACGLGKNKISPVLGRLESYRIIRVDRREGRWAVEFCANPDQWLVPLRIKPGLQANAAIVKSWLRTINAPGMEEQPEFWPPDPTLDDALYEVWRENAVARSEPGDAVDWSDPDQIAARCSESLGSGVQPVPKKGTGESVAESGPSSSQKGNGGGSQKGNHEGNAPTVPKKGTAPVPVKSLASANLLPVSVLFPVAVQERTRDTGKLSACRFLNEQLERLERAIGFDHMEPYRGWWIKHAGRSRSHSWALRETLDDFSMARSNVRDPVKWIVKTFKNKCHAISEREDQATRTE